MKPKNKINKSIEKGEELVETSECELLDSEDLRSKTLEPLRIVIKAVLEGQNPNTIKGTLLLKGYKTNMDKVYRLVRLAKKQIAKRASFDLEENYAWVQENLMDIHAKSIDEEDNRTRLVVIAQLMKLWQLDKPNVTEVQITITKDKLDDYEKMIFG